MAKVKELNHNLNFKVNEQSLCKLDEVAARLGLDRSEVARRSLAEGLRKFEHAKLQGSPERAE